MSRPAKEQAMHSVRVNGEEHVLARGTHMDAIVARFAGAQSDGVAVAVNGDIVPRREWHEREVCNGDDIEIVRAVQGG